MLLNGPIPGPGGLHRLPVPFLRTLALVLALAMAGVGVARAEAPGAPDGTAVDQLPPGQDVADTVVELAGWIVASGDNQGYPFAIMDKGAAQVLQVREAEVRSFRSLATSMCLAQALVIGFAFTMTTGQGAAKSRTRSR